MAKGSFAGNVGKGALGVGVGFALAYFLRLGGGFGFGGGRGEGRGEGQAPSPPSPPGPPMPRPPKDKQPLLFWVFEPAGVKELSKLPDPTARTREDARFLLLDLGAAEFTYDELKGRVSEILRRDPNYKAGPALSIDDVVTRVKAGGRDDVRLMTSGAIRAGTYDDAKDALMAAGIKHWELWHEWPADRKPGEPAKPALWNLYDADRAPDMFPDKNGHYHFRNVGSAFWNLRRDTSPPNVSGDLRGYYRARAAGRGRQW